MSEFKTRKWQITINNPLDYNLNHETIKKKLEELKSIKYWCMADEKGLKEETHHTHIYLYCSSPVRFTTLKKRFPEAHFEIARGTSEENRNYVFKTGEKWANSEKNETQIPETQEEWGELPMEKQGARNDLTELLTSVEEGKSNYEIITQSPKFTLHIDKIERVRQTVLEEKFKSTFRTLETTYIFGTTGTGKTRGVMETYGYENIFRVTDYQHPFDGYKGQDIIIFEEFRSSLKIDDMLNYLDGYPVELPCRYCNKTACYTKVFLISNIPLEHQYPNVQEKEPATWQAFLRRLHKVIHYTEETPCETYSLEEYLKYGFLTVLDGDDVPFN